MSHAGPSQDRSPPVGVSRTAGGRALGRSAWRPGSGRATTRRRRRRSCTPATSTRPCGRPSVTPGRTGARPLSCGGTPEHEFTSVTPVTLVTSAARCATSLSGSATTMARQQTEEHVSLPRRSLDPNAPPVHQATAVPRPAGSPGRAADHPRRRRDRGRAAAPCSRPRPPPRRRRPCSPAPRARRGRGTPTARSCGTPSGPATPRPAWPSATTPGPPS